MSEAAEQREFVTWYRATYPEYAHCLRVSQWGNTRGKSRREAAIRTAKARGQGAVDGESDIAILLKRGDFGSLLIEHKAADGNHKVSDDQQAYLDAHNDTGNCAISTRGLEPLKAAVTAYMSAGEWQ